MRRWFVCVLGGMLILGLLSGCSGEGGTSSDVPSNSTPSGDTGTMTPAPAPDSNKGDLSTDSPSTAPDVNDGAGDAGTTESPQAK
ncbi:hypothetical protein [Paenibacillus naphthalenovorans]|uniref:hypothetical protein n=1 Tax=Paenibacillus naphthalenovorans TaxID=162209 RepID=UPI0010F769C7|nr:hypothetical protein [Paenibacillus naphthalenovorans]